MGIQDGEAGPGRAPIVAKALSRFMAAFVGIGLVIFLPAGGFAWVNGWIFLGALFALMVPALAWLIARDPALLERRLRMRERQAVQKRVILVSFLIFLGLFVLPGLDHRFGWSRVPMAVSWAATLVMALGYGLFMAVLRANSWASRVIEVQEGQRVVDTGPYAIVRHPMYLATLLIYLSAPLVLGSWWALIPAAAYPFTLAARIRGEEELLARDLPGYAEYREKVRWRILPGIW